MPNQLPLVQKCLLAISPQCIFDMKQRFSLEVYMLRDGTKGWLWGTRATLNSEKPKIIQYFLLHILLLTMFGPPIYFHIKTLLSTILFILTLNLESSIFCYCYYGQPVQEIMILYPCFLGTNAMIIVNESRKKQFSSGYQEIQNYFTQPT